MVAQALLARERMPNPPPSTEGVGYYAHVIALFILFVLWRFPSAAAFAKTHQPNDPKAVKGRRFFFSPLLKPSEDAPTDDESAASSVDDEELRQVFPNATAEEITRFLSARVGDMEAAKAQLGRYLEWREKHDALEEKHLQDMKRDIDEDDWNFCARLALMSCEEDIPEKHLPRLARIYTHVDGSEVRDRDGCRILHVMPGQMDPELANPATYAVALGLYIDRKLDRASTECLTVALDVRGGKGWPNIPPLRQLPFIQTVIKLLLAMFPERLHRCLLLPVPSACRWIWNMVKVWIDPGTADKVQLLAGAARIVSEPPFEAMEEFLEPHVAKLLESERHSSFIEEQAPEEEDS